MNTSALGSFRCVKCLSCTLKAYAEQSYGEDIAEGSLVCPTCAASYPIRKAIPRFVQDQNYVQSFGFQWNRYPRTQLDSYSGRPISRTRLFDTTGWQENLSNEVILEAGCGAGRFTEVLLETGAKVYSFDYSDAVDANLKNNGHNPALHLFQADIYNIPLRPASFDKVLCLGVLQHTPDPERALKALATYVRPGGELVVDSYRKTLGALLRWKYVLRPLTKRVPPTGLHEAIARAVPVILPLAKILRRLGGAAGARLMPIVEYSHFGLPASVETEWAILDTFDMYSPVHDHPQSARTLGRWLREADFVDVVVRPAANGLAAKGRRRPQENSNNPPVETVSDVRDCRPH